MMLRRLLNLLHFGDEKQQARARLFAVKLRRGDVAIDCGANVGDVTARLARTGATVYAFEPNPYAYAKLAERFSNSDNVHCRNDAVLDEAGSMKLFLHRQSNDDPVKWSTGSSLLAGKSNIDPQTFVVTNTVDLTAFIWSLDRRVTLLKIDVEGVECRIVRHLIRSGCIDQIDHVFVEMHESRVPDLQAQAEELRRMIEERGLYNIHLDWP
jgi:FkbM family methyltransferase